VTVTLAPVRVSVAIKRENRSSDEGGKLEKSEKKEEKKKRRKGKPR